MYKYYLAIAILFLISCNSIDQSDLNLKWEKGYNHVHLGHGFWIERLADYKKSETYNGFQAPKYQISISIERKHSSIDILKSKYSAEAIKHSPLKMLSDRSIIVNKKNIGSLIQFIDKNTNIIRLRMYLTIENETFEVKAFYPKALSSKYEKPLFKSLLSIVKDEVLNDSKELKLVSVSFDDNSLIYTRDGKYPTESSDGLTLKETAIPKVILTNTHDFLRKSVEKIFGPLEKVYYGSMTTEDGIEILSIKHQNDDKKAICKLIYDKNTAEGILITCTGNKKLNFKKTQVIIQNRYLDVKLN